MSDKPDSQVPDTPPPGWYEDPSGIAALRYWDGGRWTTQIASEPPATSELSSPRGRPTIVALLGLAAVVAVVVGLAAAVLAGRTPLSDVEEPWTTERSVEEPTPNPATKDPFATSTSTSQATTSTSTAQATTTTSSPLAEPDATAAPQVLAKPGELSCTNGTVLVPCEHIHDVETITLGPTAPPLTTQEACMSAFTARAPELVDGNHFVPPVVDATFEGDTETTTCSFHLSPSISQPLLD